MTNGNFFLTHATKQQLFATCLVRRSRTQVPVLEQCLVGSLTGAVASQSVTEAFKGWLGTDGNRIDSANAKASLTVRPTSRAGTKVGVSDPLQITNVESAALNG